MSLDDLLPLLFVAVWVIGAVMRGRGSRGGRRGRSDTSGPRPTARPAAPEERRERPAADTADAADAPRPTPDPAGGEADEAGDAMRRRLEEARRRVREAMGEEVADATPPSRPAAEPAAPAPTRPPTPSGRPSAPAGAPPTRPAGGGTPTGRPPAPTRPRGPGGGLGREGVPVDPGARRSAPAGGLGREGSRPRRATVADGTGEVARRGRTPASAKLRAARGLGRSRDDVVRGFIWSIVLGEPVARRRAGRRSTSQRP